MKKLRKTMSVVLALSMLASTGITVSHAEESAEKIVMKTVDLTGYYNRNNVYRSDLSKVKYNEDGTPVVSNGKIQQTGVSGSAGYAGSFYYNSFKEDTDTYSWKTPWTDDMTMNTLTITGSGVDYDMKVVDGYVDSKAAVAWSNNEDMGKVTKTEPYTTFDIEDGYYTDLMLLANTNYSGKRSFMLVKLNYVDGTNDYYVSVLNYFSNGLNGHLIAKNKRMRGLTDAELNAGIREMTPEMLDGYGYIPEHKIELNQDKKLDSFSIINSNYYIETDAETGEYKMDEDGGYILSECEKNENGKYVLSANTRPHSVLLYAATILTNDKLELKNLKTNIEEKINNLPDDLKYADFDSYKEIENDITSYVALGGSKDDIESYPVFEEKYVAVKLLEVVSVPFDMSDMYNAPRIYDSDVKYTAGAAGYSGTIFYDSFIGNKYVTWKTPWAELEEGTIDNTLISNGVEFDLRVVDSKKNSVKTNCVFWNDSSIVKGEFTKFDVTDGKYETVEILANAETNGTSKKMVVKLNYGSEYEIAEYRLAYISNGKGADAVSVIAAPRCSGSYSTMEELEAWCDSGFYNKAYISHYSIPVSKGKTLTSVEFLNDNYTVTINEDGSYTVNDVQDVNGDGKITRNSDKSTGVAIYAMTLTSTKNEILVQKEEEILSLINELPDFEEISLENAETIEKIGEYIETYKTMGGDVENKDFYGTYLYILELFENAQPVDVNVDMTPYFNRNAVYTSGTTKTLISAAYPGAFDYDAFIGDEYLTWVTPWKDGMKENKLVSAGHTFKMRVVDYGDGDKDLSNVLFWNAATSSAASNGIGAVSGEWTNIDLLDGQYKSVEILANSNRSPASSNQYSKEEQAKSLIVRLNYSDGSEILGRNREYILNYAANGGATPVIASRRHNGSTSKHTIRHLSIPVTFGRTLESIDVLNAGYAIDETGNVVVDNVRIASDGQPYKDKNGNVLTSGGTNHNAVIYAMTLVGTKASVADANADFIAEIESKIGQLTDSSEDAALMNEIEALLKTAADRGIDKNQISNISEYNNEYSYFVKVSDVVVENDKKNAEITITFDRELADEVINTATFAIDGEELDAVKTQNNEIAVSFEHNMDYSDRELSVKIGYTDTFYQVVKLEEKAAISNVLFYQGEQIINNFHNTTNKTFTVKADVFAYANEKVMLALYNGEALYTVKTATVTEGKLSCDFTVSEDMDENWVLKAFVWDSATGMVPQNKAKVLNKTYGYDNLTDLTKDLKIVYFGDSQTEGKMFTTPLTGALEVQREDTGATVTDVNAGQGGTAIDLGMYRLDNEVIAHNPDLVIVEFFPNDSNISSKGETTAAALEKDAKLISYHENVIKRLLSLDHVPVIIYMNPMKQPDANGVVHNYYSMNVIKPLLDYYGIGLMDFQAEAERLIGTGDYTWDSFRKSSSDVHFTKDGGNICAGWMYGLMTNAATKDNYVKVPNLGLSDYQEISYEHPQMISSKYGVYDEKWEITSLKSVTEGYENPVSGDAFPGEYMAATEKGAEMTFKFKGTSLYIYTLIGAYGGKAEFEIDGMYTGTVDTYSTNSKSMYKCAKLVKSGLEDTEHTVVMRVVEPNINVKSEDAYFGIGKFMVEKN